MRIYFTILLITFHLISISGQQDALYTQFAYNKMVYNPAYSAQLKYADFTLLVRDQWNGIEGAPNTQLLSAAIPFSKQNFGLGFITSRQTQGIYEVMNLRGAYSYAMQLEEGTLSAGLELAGRRYALNFNDERLVGFEGVEGDPAIDQLNPVTYTFNVGTGLYFKSRRLFAGVSIPRMLNSKYLDDLAGSSNEVRHLYVMGGARLDLNADFEVVPQFLMKFAQNSPYDLDIQAGLIYKKEYHVGLNFRSGGARTSIGDSFAFLFGLSPVQHLFFGFSYDITLSPLRLYESGSLEVLVKYSLGENEPDATIINPRYF